MSTEEKTSESTFIDTDETKTQVKVMKKVFVCRENIPGGVMAGFCSEGNLVTDSRRANLALFATSAEAMEFIVENLPGGARNWTVERI